MKILVVDDVGYSRRSLQIALVRAGHEVVEAKSGYEALAALKKDHAIDAVVTDLLMAGIDGVDFFYNAKQLERFNDQGRVDLPAFILLTAARKGRQGTNKKTAIRLELASKMGFSEVLFKPLDQEKLLETLESVGTNGTSDDSEVLRSIGQIQQMMNSVIEAKDREAAVCLLECLGEHGRRLREFVAKEDDDG